MEGNKACQERHLPRRTVLVGVSLCGLAAIAGTGCGDHRISLAEFTSIQQDCSALPTTQPAASQPAVPPGDVTVMIDRHLGSYRVGPGDVVLVRLTGVDETGLVPPLQARVDQDGEIDLPVVGRVKIEGLPLEDVEQAIRAAYVPQVYREVAVYAELVSVDTTDVLVFGAVEMPGLVSVRRTERNLLFAILRAGGASEAASGRVTLCRLRHPDEEATLNLRNPDQLRAALALAPLEDGDIVRVEAATPNTVFVGGLVNAPRPQPYAPGVKMTVLQAIAAAGGLRTDVTAREATLIRRMPDGRDLHVKLDMDRMTTGKDPNITLAAGDILWVPHTVETRIQEWINRNIFFRAGVVATAGANYNVSYDAEGLKFLNDNARQRWGGVSGGDLQDQFDPFGFLLQNSALQRQGQLLQNVPAGQ